MATVSAAAASAAAEAASISQQPLDVEFAMTMRSRHEFLGGGFKYFLFSPLFGEDSHFD